VRAGQLRQRIDIQTVALTADGAGGATEAWSNFVTGIYAHVEPLSGRELFQAQQVNDELTHKITARYYPGITSKMRVKYGARTFLIESIVDAEERHRSLELMCKELVA
jgi:SPP1 family predicted phage head-tail adaptor